ncbi:MAG TPA: O-antigen ligase family protein, partial [Blastocatellia bacterium]|nr:O-antigen ligase family protein [Blastocatellia bacterium]
SKNKIFSEKMDKKSGLLTAIFVLLPFIALVPLIFEAPFFRDNHLPTKEVVYFAVTFVVIALSAWRFFRHPLALAMPRTQLLLLSSLAAFFIWQILSLMWAPNVGYGLRDAGIWLGLIVFLILGIKVLNASSAVWLQCSLSVVSLILSITQIIEYSKGNSTPSVFFNYGMTAELLATMLPLQVAAFLAARERVLVILSAISAGASCLALCETLRRAPMAGVLLGLLILAIALVLKVINLHNWRRLALAAILLVAFSGLQLSGSLNPKSILLAESQAAQVPLTELKRRVEDVVKVDNEYTKNNTRVTAQGLIRETQHSSLGERLRFWAIGWEMIKRHPWRGVGVAGWPASYTQYRRFYIQNPSYARLQQAESSGDEYAAGSLAHNEYVEILAELGFIGLLLFLIPAIQLAWQLGQRCWQSRRTTWSYLPIGSIAGLAAFALSSSASNFSFRQVPSTVIAISLMVLGLTKIGNKDEQENKFDERVVWLPKAAPAAALTLALVISAVMTWYSYHSLQSQRLQVEPDLQFSPTDPLKNQAWLAQYQEALAHDPYNYGAHFGCGLLLYQMKRPQEAAQHLDAARRLGYERPFVNVLLGFAYEQAGQLDAALQTLSETLASFPESFLARTVYIELLRKKGDLEASRRELEVLRQKNETLAKCLPLIMRMKPAAAMEEATRQGLPIPPYDIFPQQIERAMLQMRTFHYLP